MEKLNVSFLWRIFPKTGGKDSNCIFCYSCKPAIKDDKGKLTDKITCTGYALPANKGVNYEFEGEFVKTPKYGLQFKVSNYQTIVKKTKFDIVGYLCSGQIKGIGEKTAEEIYKKFGNNTLDILDNDIERLKEVPGIGDKKLEKITDSYLAARQARDVVAMLLPYGVTPKKATMFYKEYKDKAVETVTKTPYKLCKIKGIGFKIADKIAMNTGLDLLSDERLEQGILFALKDAQTSGHMCLSQLMIIETAKKLLATRGLTEDMLVKAIGRLWERGDILFYNMKYYLKDNALIEEELAKNIIEQKNAKVTYLCKNLEKEIDYEEKENLGFKLAPEQQQAVLAALSNPLTVITGGPGTGKSAIQKAILDIYQYEFPRCEILCCAPTGKAASRMTEASGRPASTIHKALKLIVSDDDEEHFSAKQKITADFIIIDEISMMDTFLANELFKNLPKGCQVVLIGDAEQLPSVGAGCVLYDILNSGEVPVVKLEKVFRQKAGSRIAVNAQLIKRNDTHLEYGDDYQHIQSDDFMESQKIILDLYKKYVDEVGIDNVCLLSPFKTKTETGTNTINPLIRDMVNPPAKNLAEITVGKKVFREGDKIIQMKNYENVSNGDVGYIRKIIKNSEGEYSVFLEFGDKAVEYDLEAMSMIDWAYSITVHKSQGSEYHTCIITMQKAHYVMLNKPLIYTAITRAKKRVVFVGEKAATAQAIKTEELNRRCTGLTERLHGSKPKTKIALFTEE